MFLLDAKIHFVVILAIDEDCARHYLFNTYHTMSFCPCSTHRLTMVSMSALSKMLGVRMHLCTTFILLLILLRLTMVVLSVQNLLLPHA